MAEDDSIDTVWGNVGDAVYSRRERTWLFSRRPRPTSAHVTPLLSTSELFCYSGKVPDHEEQLNSEDAGKTLQKLVGGIPEFGFAHDVLFEELSAQEWPQKSHFIEEISRGDLLAVETISLADDDGSDHAALLIANPGGSLGHVLNLTVAPLTSKTDGDPAFERFSLQRNCRRIQWPGTSMQSISQVCFSLQLDEDLALIAVRRAISIDILAVSSLRDRKILHSNTRYHQDDELDNIRCVAHWSHDDAQQVFYMDFAFNPKDHSLVVLVDSEGTWSVYQLDITSAPSHHSLISQGTARSAQGEAGSAKSRTTFDAPWRRVAWILDESLLLVCSRTMLEIFDASTGNSHICEAFEASRRERNMELLDVKTYSERPGTLFLLTSVHIIWLRVSRSDDNEVKLHYLCQWPHGHEQMNHTLKISLVPRAHDVAVLLYSAKAPVLEEYRFSLQGSGETQFPSVLDPRFIVQTEQSSSNDNGKPARTLAASAKLLQEADQKSSDPTSYVYQTFFLNDEYQLSTQVFSLGDRPHVDVDIQDAVNNQEYDQVWDLDVAEQRPAVKKASRNVDPFVVDDDDNEAEQVESPPKKRSKSFGKLGKIASTDPRRSSAAIKSWSLSYRHLYEAVMAYSRPTKSLSLKAWVEQEMLGLPPDSDRARLPHSEAQCGFTNIRLPNLERAATDVASTVSQVAARAGSAKLGNIATARVLGMQDLVDDAPSIPTIYDHLKQLWSRDPPCHAGSKSIRQRRESLIKHLAIELYVSSLGVFPAMTDGSNDIDLNGTNVMQRAVERLRCVSALANPPSQTENAVADVLAHWEVGKDPADYDHGASAARIAGVHAINADNARSLRRGKLARALYEQRIKQEDRHRDDLRMTASQPHALHTNHASSPTVHPPGFEYSSQQAGPSGLQSGDGTGQVTASQPATGVYGSRKNGLAVRTAKGKGNRKAGF